MDFRDNKGMMGLYKGLMDDGRLITIQITRCPFCQSKSISWQTRLKRYKCNSCQKPFDYNYCGIEAKKLKLYGLRNGHLGSLKDRGTKLKGTHKKE